MATVIDNKDFEKSTLVFCDCDSELLQFFKETASMTEEPYFGFKYFNSFVGKQKLKRTYFEFSENSELEKLIENLTNPNTEDDICFLTEYYTLIVTHSEEHGVVYLAVVGVNPKNYKLNKKCDFEICLTKEKAKKLATTLSGWLKNSI